MFVIVCYDIVENRRRTRVMKTLKGLGFHVQKSVFECYLDEKKLGYLEQKMRRLIDEQEDSVRIYTLPESMVEQMRVVGIGKINKLKKLILI